MAVFVLKTPACTYNYMVTVHLHFATMNRGAEQLHYMKGVFGLYVSQKIIYIVVMYYSACNDMRRIKYYSKGSC